MAKKKDKKESTNLPAKREQTELTINVSPATIKEQTDEQFSNVATPGFISEDMIEDAAPTGFNPLIDFEDEPGRWVVAKYIGTRTGVGPNNSNMYDFEAYSAERKQSFVASLWGSFILDRKMDLLTSKGSLKPGKYCFVQYLGSVPTNRGLNPAKNFKIAVIKDEAIEKYLKVTRTSA